MHKVFQCDMRSIYFEDTTADERKQNLLATLVEFHIFEDKPILSESLSDHSISTMDPIEVYKEIGMHKKVEHPDLQVCDITQMSIQEARDELTEARNDIRMIADGIAFENELNQEFEKSMNQINTDTNENNSVQSSTINSETNSNSTSPH